MQSGEDSSTGIQYSANIGLMDAELPKSLKTRRSPQAMAIPLPRAAKFPLLLTPLTYIPIGHAVLSDLGRSLRASREAAIHGVAPLGKGMPFPARRALWLTASQLAASIQPMLVEYLLEGILSAS